MSNDFRSYTLEVNLDDMPDGWLLFAIGERKPCIAPPPVMDEIKSLQSRLDDWHKVADDRAAEIVRLQDRLDQQAKRLGEMFDLLADVATQERKDALGFITVSLRMRSEWWREVDAIVFGSSGSAVEKREQKCSHLAVNYDWSDKGPDWRCAYCGERGKHSGDNWVPSE